jgi:hypothetical protein
LPSRPDALSGNTPTIGAAEDVEEYLAGEPPPCLGSA